MSPLLLDPSIASANTGDQMIRESIDRALLGVVQISQTLPTHIHLTPTQRMSASQASLAIIGGTNLLSSNMPWYQQWKLGPRSIRALRGKVVLLGVGWWQYQNEPNAYTRWVLEQVLSKRYAHSVRDEYTKVRLSKLGFKVKNTACPTMWDLDQVAAASGRPSTAVVTLTDYNPDPVEDQWLLDIVGSFYDRTIIWPQSRRDADYAQDLKGPFEVAEPTLRAYDALLMNERVDYVGTRLHGGIRGFVRGSWGVIIAVDNRAMEIGRDTGLPVYPRGNREDIKKSLEDRVSYPIRLPQQEIDEWRSQFEGSSNFRAHDMEP